MSNLPQLTKQQQTALEFVNFANNSGRTAGCIHNFWNWLIANDAESALSILDEMAENVTRMNKAGQWLNSNLYDKAMAFYNLQRIHIQIGGNFVSWSKLVSDKAPVLELPKHNYEMFNVSQSGSNVVIVSKLA